MTNYSTIFTLALAAIIWGSVYGLQRPPPRYSQQYMPQTSFTCRNKIVGSYYADPETDCQLFHVCVSVAGSIQDYRFLCPNDTAFDQESQTCADWYDVDCEAATLYYASDNFDLYRIGSGLESLHYDSIRSDFEPQDHLQRSESNDPIRSPLNAYNSNYNKEADAPKKSSSLRANDYASSSRGQKQIAAELVEKEKSFEPEKKLNSRKVNRKPANNLFNAGTSKATTLAPVVSSQQPVNRHSFVYTTTTSQRPSPQPSTPRPLQVSSSTPRITTRYTSTTTARTTANTPEYSNYPSTTTKTSFHNNFNNFNRFETTAKPTTYYPEYQATASTTKQPEHHQYNNQASNFEQRSYNNHNNNNNNNNNQNNYNNHQNNYNNHNNNYNNNNNNNNYNNNYNNNNVQRVNTTAYPSTTQASNHNYDSFNNNYNANYESSKNYNQNSYTANTYAPTTYNPVTKKFASSRQYYDKSTTLTTKSAGQYAETDSTKITKKVTTHYKNNYQNNNNNNNNNFESSTRSYQDFGRSSVGLGFSPSSVNHLAENVRSTTPSPRRAAAPTTYNPGNFHVNTHAPQSQVTQQKAYHQNQQAKQYSTTAKYFEAETTIRPKITKKNDYDYAYYDNGPLEYDNIELEHVTSNKESVKIT